MSLWGFVSSLSDSGASFIASTARDLADFKHALRDETRDIHIPSLAAAAAPASPAGQAGDGGLESEAAGGSGAASSRSASADSERVASVASSLSSLSGNIERLGDRVLHFLPAVFRGEDDSGAGGSGSGGGVTAGHAALPASPVARPGPADGGSGGGGGGSAGGAGSLEQRLLALMRDRRTYVQDPAPAAAYIAYVDCLDAAWEQQEAAALLAGHPSIRHWHERLVDAGEVDERSFWRRLLFARHCLQADHARRQRLASRLAGIGDGSAAAAQLQWEEDDSDTSDDDERADQPAEARRRPAAQRDSAADASRDSDQPPPSPPPASAPDESGQCEAEGDIAHEQRADRLEAEAKAGGEEAEGREGELLSASPVDSEGSGELIEHDEAPAAAGMHTSHESRHSEAALSTAAAGAEDDAHESDYDEWD